MADLHKIKATCKHCNKEFVLQFFAIDPDELRSGEFPMRAVQFGCTHCHKMNTFTKEEVVIID